MKVLLLLAGLVAAASAACTVPGEVFCKPNQLFDLECNKCKCDSDGKRYRCFTNKPCPSRDHYLLQYEPEGPGSIGCQVSKICLPGKMKQKFCNTCICNANGGSYACTTDICDTEMWNEDGSMKYGKCKPGVLSYEWKDYKNPECRICRCTDSRGDASECMAVRCNEDFRDFSNEKLSAMVVSKPLPIPI